MIFDIFSWFSWICSRISHVSQHFNHVFGSKKTEKTCFFGLKINKTSLNHSELYRKTLWTTTNTHKVSYYAIIWKFDEMGAYFIILFWHFWDPVGKCSNRKNWNQKIQKSKKSLILVGKPLNFHLHPFSARSDQNLAR